MMLGVSLHAQVYQQCHSHWQSDHLLSNVNVWYDENLNILRLNPYLKLRVMAWTSHVNVDMVIHTCVDTTFTEGQSIFYQI